MTDRDISSFTIAYFNYVQEGRTYNKIKILSTALIGIQKRTLLVKVSGLTGPIVGVGAEYAALGKYQFLGLLDALWTHSTHFMDTFHILF